MAYSILNVSTCIGKSIKIKRVKEYIQGLFRQFWEKTPDKNLEKMIYLTSKLGEINDIEHNKGSKIYP